MTLLTINQLMTLLKGFATDHPQLDDFGYGPTYDIGTSRQMRPAYMWVTHEIDSTVQVINQTTVPTLNLTFLFVDKINDQENYLDENGYPSNNTQEVISDMYTVTLDFIGFVQSNLTPYGISIADDIVSQFVINDETDDKVAGWGVRIPFKIKYQNSIFC